MENSITVKQAQAGRRYVIAVVEPQGGEVGRIIHDAKSMMSTIKMSDKYADNADVFVLYPLK